MFAVIDCITQEVMETGEDYESLVSKYDEIKGLNMYIDFYLSEMYVIIDRKNQQRLATALTIDEALKQINYELEDDYFIGMESDFNKYTCIFLNEKTNEYIAVKDGSLTMEQVESLEMNGFVLYSDIVTGNVGQYLKLHGIDATAAKYEMVPVTLKDAQQFVNNYHRHLSQPQGHKFSVGIKVANQLIGVIIAARPVARLNDDGYTLEVTRCCVMNGFKNAVTKLYGAVCRIAKAMGYKNVITYTLETENGHSMKASGFVCEKKSKGGSWNTSSRKRIDKHPTIPKFKWIRKIA